MAVQVNLGLVMQGIYRCGCDGYLSEVEGKEGRKGERELEFSNLRIFTEINFSLYA